MRASFVGVCARLFNFVVTLMRVAADAMEMAEGRVNSPVSASNARLPSA